MSVEPGRITKIALVAGIIGAAGLLLVNIYAGYRKIQQAESEAIPSTRALESLRRPGSAFAAVDQNGVGVTQESLKGKAWVASFVFTNCQGPCPVITRRMKEIQDQVADLPDVRLVSFSVDPARDTPEVLHAYAALHGAVSGRWHFLTGEPEAQLAVVQQGFLTAVQPVEGTDQVIHGTMLALVDKSGEIRGFYDGLAVDTPKRVAHVLRVLHDE
jgi:protein SCO1/2